MAQERLQKILSECGAASRRKAEEWIAAGRVKVNGHMAALGTKADSRRDVITVDGRRIAAAPALPVYIMLNKPRGYVTTLNDERGRRCVAELVAEVGARVYPIGRLDKDSEGLLLLTNDGELAHAIMHPSQHVPKQYRVTVRGHLTDEQRERFISGIELDGRLTAPAELTVLEEREDRSVAVVVLHEGRNRQIRRMFEALGVEVMRLKRTHVGSIKLGMLPVGQWRRLDVRELRSLLALCPGRHFKMAEAYIREQTKGGVRR